MERVNPTRINLLAKRAEAKQLGVGIELLRNKKDVLLKEFFSAIGPLSSLRAQLEAKGKEARFSLILALGFSGKEDLHSHSFVTERDLDVQIAERNLWGVRVPELSAERPPTEGGFGGIGTSIHLEDTQERFVEFIRLALKVLPEEVKLKRLGKEIRATSRKVNFLEKYLLPGLFAQLKYIQNELNEREGEDIFRLKRIKKKKGEYA